MNTKKVLLFVTVAIVLFALISCNKQVSGTDIWSNAIYTESKVLGEGEKTITVKVSADGKEIVFAVLTDAETLGEALLENGLIEGRDSEYGIYIEKVNGILADYDIDGYYWSLTKKGEYLMTGADMTPISNGDEYEITRTK